MKSSLTMKKRKKSGAAGILLMVLFSAAILIFVWQGMGKVSQGASAQQLRYAQTAVRRTAVQCYALEGRFPPSLQYMEDEYGLMIDHEKILVHYIPAGGNLMPEIRVLPVDSGEAYEEEFLP